jgi:hypothetical protein
LTNQKLDEINQNQFDKEHKLIPNRSILKNVKKNFFKINDNDSLKSDQYLDGFYLMQLYCIEDPLDLSIVDLTNKGLIQVKIDDLLLFENLTEINASENSLSFESFSKLKSLIKLSLACNNIRSLRVKHEEFISLESLDLSYNSLFPNDIAHLGILPKLKSLKLTGNNLKFLPDTFSKLYVKTAKDEKKQVNEKFPNLEELFLDHNQLREDESFVVLALLKRLKRLHLNNNNILSIPNLQMFRKNHVFQEFNSKSYLKRKHKASKLFILKITIKNFIIKITIII